MCVGPAKPAEHLVWPWFFWFFLHQGKKNIKVTSGLQHPKVLWSRKEKYAVCHPDNYCELNKVWWQQFKPRLEQIFKHEEILIRFYPVWKLWWLVFFFKRLTLVNLFLLLCWFIDIDQYNQDEYGVVSILILDRFQLLRKFFYDWSLKKEFV